MHIFTRLVLTFMVVLSLSTSYAGGINFGMTDKAMTVPHFKTEQQAVKYGNMYKGNGLYYSWLLGEREMHVKTIEAIERKGAENFTEEDSKEFARAGIQITYITIALDLMYDEAMVVGADVLIQSIPVRLLQ